MSVSVFELFGETISNIFWCCNLLLNVMDVLSVGGGALLHRPCMDFYRVCVCVVPAILVCI